MRILAGAIIGLAFLTGCAGQDLRPPRSYVVLPHDTLYSIAWRNGLDYRDLAAWNHLGPDFRIAVGERLTLEPPASGYAAARHGESAPRAPR
ncbi:MAG: LysM peptidoglycan-binding domain-containing protein, partial [Gammaproteobacteria bacterium]|nr:LysM peptidoglycan-binding domain-containing protein [Gammaproteobacteria bacterium]